MTESVIKDIYNDQDYWFIAFCVTPWHLMGVRAFVEGKRKYGKCPKGKHGAIVVIPHPKTGNCINKEMVADLNIYSIKTVINANADMNRLSKGTMHSFISRAIAYNKAHLQDRYILSTLEPFLFCELNNFEGQTKNKLVLIDEGVSSYTSQLEYILHSRIESKSWAYAFKLAIRLIVSNMIKAIYNVYVTEWLLFNKDAGFTVNESVADSYRNYYSSINPSYHIPAKSIIYISQPPVTQAEKIAILKLINELADKCSLLGYSFYIKCHPRDDIESFSSINNVTLLPNTESMEALYAKLTSKPRLIIGFRSTALITLHAFYKVQCVSVLRLTHKEFRKTQNSDDIFFYRSFKRQIAFVNSLEEITKLIREY